ncbi:MAG: hypothetical protein C0615_04730, partial [Desulfuromonas sp.]
MPISDFKAIHAEHNGRKIKGIYKREVDTFTIKKGITKLTLPEYEYSFDFTVNGKRFRSIFGKESNFGKIGATGKWESWAVEKAVEALLRFRSNAKTGEGPTSIKEERYLLRKTADEKKKQEKREKTVEQLVELFLEDIAISAPGIKTNKPRTIKEYKLNLYRDVIPAIGKLKAKDVEREDITEIIEKIVKRGKITQANRTLAACSRLFNWALSKGRVRYNPCAQMKKYNEKPRERVLTEPEQRTKNQQKSKHEEIKTLWQKLSEDTETTEARILMLCILLGTRPNEICRMKWENIDEDNWWAVHKDEIKTDVALECYLTRTALNVLGTKKKNGVLPRVYGHFKKAYSGQKECLCRKEGNSVQSS